MSGKGQFVGRVDGNGKLDLYNRQGFAALCQHLKGKQVVLTMGAHKPTRSNNQNRYLWGVVVKTLADELGYTSDEMFDALKFKFLRIEAEPENGRILPTVKSTSKLDTADFERFLDDVRMWAARDLGIIIPLPHEELAA
jgi:hypothetical protein